MNANKYKATISWTTKLESGIIQGQTKNVKGSRTAIFNAMNDILAEDQVNIVEDLIDMTVIIRRSKH